MSAISEAISKKKDRAIAICLGIKERDVDIFLPEDVQRKLRKVILDQFNELSSFAVDMVDSLEGGTVFNQIYLEKMEQHMEQMDRLFGVLTDG